MTQPLLTICVPTVSHRAGLLSRLLWSIGEQAQTFEGQFEVLIHPGDDIAYGDKLNRMFEEAQGKYVTDCGDDDWVSSSYLSLLHLAASEEDFDLIGYKILYTEDGLFQREIAHSAAYSGYTHPSLQGVTQRCWIRREIAASVPFGNEYTADRVWGPAVQDKIEKHAYVDRVLYYYDHWMDYYLGTAPDHIPDNWKERDVGEWDYNFPWWEGPVWLATS